MTETPHAAADTVSRIALPQAVTGWLAAWLGGSVLLSVPLLVAFDVPEGGSFSIPQLAALALVSWSTFVGMLLVVSRRAGSGDFVADFAVSGRLVDLVAVPVGVIGQLVLVPAVYWPLQRQWPDTFSDAKLEERALELVDRAGGLNTALLIAVVVVGAPVVEELVYRGLIQRSMASVVRPWPALVLTALWFAAIHLAAVETPGLFVAGLLFGGFVVLTGRIVPAVLAHAAFNAAGLVAAFGMS